MGEGIREHCIVAIWFDVLVLVGEMADEEGFFFDLLGTPSELY
jgi:hypothetical protein